MGSRLRTTAPAPRRRRLAAGALLLLAACGAPGLASAGRAPRPELAEAVDAELRPCAFPTGEGAGARAADELARLSALVVTGGPRADDLDVDGAAVAAIRDFVARGGRVLLLGRAVQLVDDLGLETRGPDVHTAFRWGFDARTAQGRARLGFQVVSSHCAELVEGMQPAPQREHAFYVGGGAPLDAALCLFALAPPARGEVLGQLAIETDGTGEVRPAAVLVHWAAGPGAVLGLGLEPDVASNDAVVRQNGRRFLHQAASWLFSGRPTGPLGYWTLGDGEPVAASAPWPRAAEREVPGAQALAHWGVVARVHEPLDAADRGSVGPNRLVLDALLPSAAAGASVFSLDVVDPQQGLPVPWAETDPLARPKDWRGSAFSSAFPEGSVERIAREAHARSMLLQARLDPLPFGDDPRVRLASLRFLAREWGDVRRLREGAVDGLTLREWFSDERGHAVQMLQDFQPAGHLVRVGECAPPVGGSLAALDSRDGRPQGLRAFGITTGWRDGFPAERNPIGYLDASERTLPAAPGESAPSTGGSYPDWVAQQAIDFARERRFRGGAMLWHNVRAAAKGPLSDDYVRGVSAEPMVAAVAARCTATGVDGYRAAQQALLPEVHSDFAQTVPVAAAVVQLRNNHLRLFGSGGPLEFDVDGLARFTSTSLGGGSGAVRLADSFVKTRFFGGRPDAESMRSLEVDLGLGGRRPEGGYADGTWRPGGPRAIDASLPAQIAFAESPRWPSRIRVPLPADTGRFDLHLRARALRGRGVLAVGVDDEPLTMLPFAQGRLQIDATLALHLASKKGRELLLEVQDGGALAIDVCKLRRAGDVAAESVVVKPAGALAALREVSSSTYHREVVELSTLADFPGFLLRADCEFAVRGLQQERRFGLLHHRTLRRSTGGESAGALRRPFVLAADDPALPDLAIVPLRLSRYESFRLQDGELVLTQAPESNTRSTIGFCFVSRQEAGDALPHLERVLSALDRPTAIELGEQGGADLVSDLPIAWTRALRIATPAPTPFFVCEGGWWTWRGATASSDGASLLRVTHLPGDLVQVVGGQSLWSRTRPGLGSTSLLALKDPAPDRATVRVLQPSSLHAPVVTMGADFDEVLLDGKPWAWFDGRDVMLPNAAGTYSIETRSHGGGSRPHVTSTGAPLQYCAFDASSAELVFVAGVERDRPTGLPYSAVVTGTPVSVDGGEIVDERDFRRRDAGATALARAAGTLIRFRPGVVKVRYAK